MAVCRRSMPRAGLWRDASHDARVAVFDTYVRGVMAFLLDLLTVAAVVGALIWLVAMINLWGMR